VRTKIGVGFSVLCVGIASLATPVVAQQSGQRKPAVSEQVMALYEPGEFKGVKYRLMKPIDFDAEKTYPLVLSLHGAGGRGRSNIATLRNWNEMMAEESVRRRHPCFVLAPQTSVTWSDPTSLLAKTPEITDELLDSVPEEMRGFLARIKDNPRDATVGDLGKVLEYIDTELTKQYKIDVDRVYCLGHSMRGFGTFTAIYQHPERFAAAIPSAGGFGPWRDVSRIKDVPIWAFHGSDDPVVKYIFTKHAFDRLEKIGGNMKFTTLEGVNHGANAHAFVYQGDDPAKGFTTAYASDRCDKTPEIWDWLFQQKR
jgi:predicted peptidase